MRGCYEISKWSHTNAQLWWHSYFIFEIFYKFEVVVRDVIVIVLHLTKRLVVVLHQVTGGAGNVDRTSFAMLVSVSLFIQRALNEVIHINAHLICKFLRSSISCMCTYECV